MKKVVISYSFTGNNATLADRIAKELKVEHIRITEQKPRTNGTIAMDMLFGRTPKVGPSPEVMNDHDLIIFFGPVWMGSAAAPLRAYLKYLRKNPRKYAFITISGGADGPNRKLAKDLKKRVKKEPVALLDLLIVDLIPSEPKPTRAVTSEYKLNENDVEKLTDTIMKTLRKSKAI